MPGWPLSVPRPRKGVKKSGWRWGLFVSKKVFQVEHPFTELNRVNQQEMFDRKSATVRQVTSCHHELIKY